MFTGPRTSPRSTRSTRPARLVTAATAAATAGGLVLLAAAPGTAAAPIAQATATALVLTIASTPTDSGTYAVTNDGKRESATGSNEPIISALGGQSFLSAGTLAQDATTELVGDSGRSAACAGLAGDGATLVAAGDGACLTPRNNATINAGNIELGDLTIVQADLLMGLDATLQAALQPLLDAVLPAAQGALETALSSLGDLGLVLDLGAIQSQCTAAPGTADGDSLLTGAALFVEIDGQRVDLVSLPVDPPPNTKVITDLDVVIRSVTEALQEQLETGLEGALAPAGPLVGELEAALNDNIVSVIAEQLAPLEDNVLDGTLNKQVRAPGQIAVTALDLAVLPAAREAGVDLLAIEIGKSTCGPSGRIVVPPPTPTPTPPPDVPTSVPSGSSDAAPRPGTDGGINDQVATGALAVLALLAGAAGVTAYRRVLRG